MKLAATLFVLVAVAASLANGASAGGDEGVLLADLPENFRERIEAILKWFEMRIPVYQKANILLKQLARKVNALPSYHNNIDIFYRKWLDFPGMPMRLTLARGVINGTRTEMVSDMLKQALNQKEIKYVLTMMPEVRSAFNKLV